MKTIWTLFLGLLIAVNCATAQDKLYVYKAGVVIYEQAISGVDSITFYKIDSEAKDVDGNIYKTVIIGNQTWMAENLRTTRYRNGDAITNVTGDAQWAALITGAWCNYNNDPVMDTKYGKYYNFYAIADARKIAPTGWHVATDAEWTTLANYVAANVGNSISLAKALAATTDWTTYATVGAIGCNLALNNSTGFSALPIGYHGAGGSFYSFGIISFFWTATEYSATGARLRELDYNYNNIGNSYTNKKTGYPVRCVKD